MNIFALPVVYFLKFLNGFGKVERSLNNTFWSGVVLAALCLGGARLDAATFTASLDRDTMMLGESVTLSLTFEGSTPRAIPALPLIPNLQIGNSVSSRNINIVNDQMVSTFSKTFELKPTKTGNYVIPALQVEVDGQILMSQPLKLTVTPPNAPPPEAINSGSEVAFMRLSLAKTNFYIGEVTTANIKIYLRDDVQNHSQPQITSLPTDGFSAGKGTYQNAYSEQIGNRVYTVIPASIALTATKTGTARVGPVTGNIVVVLPSSNRGGDPFFRQFFNTGEQKQVTLATETLNVESLPLPAESVPPNFNGAVGDYTMTVTAGPTNVAVGDPITVRVQISGHGALDALTLPDQPAWRDFKAYPPTQNIKTTDQLGIEGVKTFEQIVTPQNTDVHELPAFSFSFFDPGAKTYRTLTQPPVQLAVHSGGTTPAPMIAATKTANSQTPAPQDLLPIKEQSGALTPARPPLLTRPVFLAAQSLPVLAWLAAFVWRKRTDSLANNPRLRRQRRVAGLVQSGLDDLRQFATENNSDEFFATLFRLLQEQLGERLDCPASSITEAVIDERLVPLGTPELTLAGLRELFQLCNQARYAPMRTSGELAAVIPQFENAVRELQNVKA
jgi:hypothetical protein